MQPVGRPPRWQQMTALVSLSTGGAMTAFSLVPGTTAAALASPTSAHIRLLALQQAVRPALADDGRLRSAIVNVANYYLRMAVGRTPAEMEALIWQHDSIDGVDHGESCAAFASLTLELAAQVVGQQSWVTGGTTYPWPLHKWADVRVETNPASPGIISILQDAEVHGRWHPLGDGYRPLPGDWVLFDGHVEVVTKFAGGVLHTIGGDSLPNLSVNAHAYPDPLAAQGVAGFVNNGELPATASHPHRGAGSAGGHQAPAHHRAARGGATVMAASGQAAIPGAPDAPAAKAAARPPRGASVAAVPAPGSVADRTKAPAGRRARPGWERGPQAAQPAGHLHGAGRTGADVPGTGRSAPVATLESERQGTAVIPGLTVRSPRHPRAAAARPATGYSRYQPPSGGSSLAGTAAQEAFIREIAPGARATQSRYGVPAAVTIAQAIDESGWGSSVLATQDHNLFGIKGDGPAGSELLPTQEYQNGQLVTQMASFRVYRSIAESIDDHGKLLATSGYYRQSMADNHDPNAFAAALTGTYATDPQYGAKLIGLMQRYDLYRYDAPPRAAAAARGTAQRGAAASGAAAATRPPHAPAGGGSAPGRAARAGASVGRAGHRPGGRVGTPRSPGRRAPAGHAVSPHARSPVASSSPATPAIPAAGLPARGAKAAGTAAPASPRIPGVPRQFPAPSPVAASPPAPAGATSAQSSSPGRSPSRASADPSTQTVSAKLLAAHVSAPTGKTTARRTRGAPIATAAYRPHLPPSVKQAFTAKASGPLSQAEPLYRDVAAGAGVGWELLAACDWMQCRAGPRHSAVHGEKLGTVNPDGTIFRTKSASLEQCADDLVALAMAVYRIDLTAPGHLSVRDLANAFAAFRWGGLLRMHRTSSMEFPYSVAGLTEQHVRMRWPNIDEPNTPDKPGARFRMPFGAVPVVLGLGYPATV